MLDSDLPKKGEIWQHYKGDFYEIIDVSIDEAESESDEQDYIIRYRPARGAYMWRIHTRSVYRGKGFLVPVFAANGLEPTPRYVLAGRDELGYPIALTDAKKKEA